MAARRPDQPDCRGRWKTLTGEDLIPTPDPKPWLLTLED
jgi:hypothetical protein